jgi:hypothetical protein
MEDLYSSKTLGCLKLRGVFTQDAAFDIGAVIKTLLLTTKPNKKVS